MDIAIVGTGYVGLVSGTCFAETGANVYCIDTNDAKISTLKAGEIPIYEPKLEGLVRENVKAGRLHFETELASVLDKVEIVFLAVGTPPDKNGNADLRYVMEVARTIGKNMSKYLLVVTKSTVPVGTSEEIRKVIEEEQLKRGVSIGFDMASNPEFLKEGSAIEDFMNPERVVIGVDNEHSNSLLQSLYNTIPSDKIISMDIASSEMTKYAANAMLATRISFMNDIANLCEKLGADVDMVRKGISLDSRIGSKFLNAGCGYGGSCFPKDVKALLKTGENVNYELSILDAVEKVNSRQKKVLFEKFKKYFGGDIKNKKVAIWGLAFKPNTDDMRDAPSLVLIKDLLEAGCDVTVFDPIAMTECKRHICDAVKYATDPYDCVTGKEVLFHLTEWNVFKSADWKKVKSLMAQNPLLIDGRNIFSNTDICGINYLRIGKVVK